MKHEKAFDVYLEASPYIDYFDPGIQELIVLFKEKESSEIDLIRAVFQFVRDEIKHI